MKNWLIILLGCLATFGSKAQSLQVEIPQINAPQGQTIEIPLTVADFDSIVSLQFSINWNPGILQYQSAEKTELMDAAVGEVEVDQGKLRYSWFDADGNGDGVSLDDETIVLILTMQAIGTVGSESPVVITGDPLDVQIVKNENGAYTPINIANGNGSVTIVDPINIEVTTQIIPVSCYGTATGIIDLGIQYDGGNYTVQWAYPDGNISTEEDIMGLNAGIYELVIFDENGDPIFTETYEITQPDSIFIIDLPVQNTECEASDGGVTFEFEGGTPPYLVDIGNGPVNQFSFSDLVPDDYDFTVTDANGCSISGFFTIETTPLPVLDLAMETSFCEGGSVQLEVGNFESYNWSTGAQTELIEITEEGTYSVTVTNEFGCSNTAATTAIALDGLTLTLENDVLEICSGDSIQLLVSGGDQYQWIDATGAFLDFTIPNPVVAPDTTTLYFVQGSNNCGQDTLPVEVFVFETEAAAMNDTCVFLGDELMLLAGGGASYLWDDNAEYPLNAYNIFNPRTTPEDSTFYAVTITDANGCLTRDTVFVTVLTNPAADIPAINILTPNGDGENDVLQFSDAIEKYGRNKLTVFNRWGDVVYDRINYQRDDARFDGTKNGKPLPSGTYYYVLAFTDASIKQTLLIVR